MIHITLHREGDDAFKDTPEMIRGEVTDCARLTRGMNSGKSSVALRIKLDDGRWVFAETSMSLFLNAANAMQAFEESDGLR